MSSEAPAARTAPADLLVPFSRGPADRPPLFFMHGADGQADIFAPLAEALGPAWSVHGVRARGLVEGETPFGTIEDMAAAYVEAIEAQYPSGPVVLGGHSGGGVIAYEMAQQFAQRGRMVPLIVMIDTLEPRDLARPIAMRERLALIPRAHPEILLEWPLNRLRDFRSFLYRKHAVQTLGDRVGAAYIDAQSRYTPRPYRGAILLVKATRARAQYIRAGAKLGWEKTAQGPFDVVTIKGDHLTMFREPALSKLAQAISVRLAPLI